jgi:gluconate kinase
VELVLTPLTPEFNSAGRKTWGEIMVSELAVKVTLTNPTVGVLTCCACKALPKNILKQTALKILCVFLFMNGQLF